MNIFLRVRCSILISGLQKSKANNIGSMIIIFVSASTTEYLKLFSNWLSSHKKDRKEPQRD
jgi:hypothetical protein